MCRTASGAVLRPSGGGTGLGLNTIILVDVRLDGPSDRQLNGEMLVDLLWAHARPDHCNQHITGRLISFQLYGRSIFQIHH